MGGRGESEEMGETLPGRIVDCDEADQRPGKPGAVGIERAADEADGERRGCSETRSTHARPRQTVTRQQPAAIDGADGEWRLLVHDEPPRVAGDRCRDDLTIRRGGKWRGSGDEKREKLGKIEPDQPHHPNSTGAFSVTQSSFAGGRPSRLPPRLPSITA